MPASACTLSGFQPQGLAQAGPGEPVFWVGRVSGVLAIWSPLTGRIQSLKPLCGTLATVLLSMNGAPSH